MPRSHTIAGWCLTHKRLHHLSGLAAEVRSLREEFSVDPVVDPKDSVLGCSRV